MNKKDENSTTNKEWPEPLNDQIKHSEGFTGGTMNLEQWKQIQRLRREVFKRERIKGIVINENLSAADRTQ